MPRELFVARIPTTVSVEALRSLFEQAGKVTFIKRPRDHETGEFRTFAFVTMDTEEEGNAAIERLNGYLLEGSEIVVKESDKPFQPPVRPAFTPAVPRVAPPPAPDFAWDDRTEVLETLLENPGNATTVKITVVGRPEQVEERGSTVLLLLQHFTRREGYPRGVPTPPDTPNVYLIFIAAKQWRKIKPSLSANADDVLIVEGQVAFDPEIPGMAVFATGVNTKLLQQASRTPQGE